MTHTFHIPLDVSGRPARQLTVIHASKKDGLLQRVGLTPTADRFPTGSFFFTHSVNVHIYKQFILESSGTSKREETQTRRPSGGFFFPFLANGY